MSRESREAETIVLTKLLQEVTLSEPATSRNNLSQDTEETFSVQIASYQQNLRTFGGAVRSLPRDCGLFRRHKK